jgi:uncharacterized Zn-binding protein involved in type VI secretion
VNIRGIVVIGSKSNHDGEVITGAELVFCNYKRVARVGDYHFCPKTGHGITKIIGPVNEKRAMIEGKPVALVGDKAECGATIVESCPGTGNIS